MGLAPGNGIIAHLMSTCSKQNRRSGLGTAAILTSTLFVVRVGLEATGRPWPALAVTAACLFPAVIALGLSRWLAARHSRSPQRGSHHPLRPWPALLLLLYILWPKRDLALATAVSTLAVLAYLLDRSGPSLPRWAEPLADGATFLFALALYGATAARDVLPADSGEFQLVAALLGVAHPPGYPLYTLMGHLFIRLYPWGTPALRLNLMSALLAAGTLVWLARATRLWAGRLGAPPTISAAGGLAAAMTLGSATTFWAQATVASIRMPTLFFASLALYALARFVSASQPDHQERSLILLGLALGLGLGHHPSLAFVALFFLVYLLLAEPGLAVQPRRWWRPALAALAGLLPLAYLPIRGPMGAPLAPEGLDTLPGFLWHVLARGFAGDMFAFANPTDLPHRIALLSTLFPFQFNFPLLAASALGLCALLWRDWRLFVLLSGSLALHSGVSITYRAPQTVEYLMPAYLPVALAVGLLPACLSNQRAARWVSDRESLTLEHLLSSAPPLLGALVLVAGLLNGWAHAASFFALARDNGTRQTVEPLLESAPAQAIILADWHWATPLWYLQQVEGLRSDVDVLYVYNVSGEEYPDTWQRRVREADPERPLLLTHFYEFPGYTTEPWHMGFLVRPRPVSAPAASLTPVGITFGRQVRLVGYATSPRPFRASQSIEFILAWQAAGLLHSPPSFTLRLADASGNELAQADRWLGTDCAPGEVRFVRLLLPLYPTLTPGRYEVRLGAYTVTDSGFTALPSGEGESFISLLWIDLQPSLQSPFTVHAQSVPFAGGPTLVGVDYDRSLPEHLHVYLHWRGPVDGPRRVELQSADGAGASAYLPSLPQGAYQTIALDLPGLVRSPLYLVLTDEQGLASRCAGPWGWPLAQVRLPSPAPDDRFVLLGDEMALVGVNTSPIVPGQTAVVDLTLVGLRPLVSDDATSVRLTEATGRWLAAHDSQPALGAVPTLKWIRGSRVVDRHLLEVPADYSGEGTVATLVAYERFRLTPLPPMDERRLEPVPLWGPGP